MVFRRPSAATKNVLRVAAEGRRKTMHYISSIDVWAVTGLILGTDDEPGAVNGHWEAFVAHSLNHLVCYPLALGIAGIHLPPRVRRR
jgi:hypothetical protein